MGNSIYTSSELIDSIIVDFNNIIKNVVSGQHIQACYVVTSISQKLINLKTGLENDIKGKDATIESLKQSIKELGGDCVEHSADEYIKGNKNDG